MAEGEVSGKSLNSAASILEKVFEIKFFFVIGCLFFLLDNCLVVFSGKNILNFEYHSDIVDKSLGNIILFIFLFSLLVAFLFPILRLIIMSIILKLYLALLSTPLWNLIYKYEEDSLNNQYVDTVGFRSIRERDEFTLKRVAEVRKQINAQKETLDLMFAFTCLLVANIWIVGSDKNISITQKLNEVLIKNYFGWSLITYYVYWSSVIIFIVLSVIGLKPDFEKMYAPQQMEKKDTRKRS